MINDQERFRILNAALRLSQELGRQMSGPELMKFYAETTGGTLEQPQLKELHLLGDIKAKFFTDSSGTPRVQKIEVSPEGGRFIEQHQRRRNQGKRWVIVGVVVPLAAAAIGILPHLLGNRSITSIQQPKRMRDQVGGDIQANGPVNYTVNNYQSDTEERDSIAQARRQTSVTISRLVEDFDRSVTDIQEQHRGAINRIAGEMNGRGILHSGIHLTRQYEQVRASQQEIADHWLRCWREVEDALIKSGDTEIQDADLKSAFENAEHRKDEAIAKILLRTDEYLGSRGSHDLAMIKSAKKQVFGDE